MQLLSLALVFAQLGMVAHASSHLKADQHTTQTQLCGQCLSSAPLQNMAGGGATILLQVDCQRDHVAEAAALPVEPLRPFVAFRSRAPPVS